MSKKTKKAGLSAKFGARYGVRLRRQIAEIGKKAKQKYACPSCNYKSVKRISSGIWKCSKCGLVFTGGAYIPVTQMAKERKNVQI